MGPDPKLGIGDMAKDSLKIGNNATFDQADTHPQIRKGGPGLSLKPNGKNGASSAWRGCGRSPSLKGRKLSLKALHAKLTALKHSSRQRMRNRKRADHLLPQTASELSIPTTALAAQ